MRPRAIPWPAISRHADLGEALDTIELLTEALAEAIGNGAPSERQAAAIEAAQRLRRKHHHVKPALREA